MTPALEKAQRHASKVTNFLRHLKPANDAREEDIIRWARAADAANTIERYLERCAKDMKQCTTRT